MEFSEKYIEARRRLMNNQLELANAERRLDYARAAVRDSTAIMKKRNEEFKKLNEEVAAALSELERIKRDEKIEG